MAYKNTVYMNSNLTQVPYYPTTHLPAQNLNYGCGSNSVHIIIVNEF